MSGSQAKIDALMRRVAARKADMERVIAGGPRPIRVPLNIEGWWAFVHPSTRSPGKWQATRFDGDEPIGDTENASWEALLRNLHYYDALWEEAVTVKKGGKL